MANDGKESFIYKFPRVVEYKNFIKKLRNSINNFKSYFTSIVMIFYGVICI